MGNDIELTNTIIGLKLIEINKNVDDIKMIFEDVNSNVVYILTFKGYLFETGYVALNKRVEHANLRRTLGFKAVTQLRYEGENPAEFKQLLIQMEGSDDENKIEIISVFKEFSLTTKTLALMH